MTIHREGRTILSALLVVSLIIGGIVYTYWPIGFPWVAILLTGFFLLVLQFFRHPSRPIPLQDDQLIYAPADGRVVVIEETEEGEYFKDRRIQLSIFMSPLNVHVNRYPCGGEVSYYQYHPGKYLVAWHPKSSTENERSTVVIQNGKTEILLRQIAGAVARRIKTYTTKGQKVEQGGELGFISFGSRVDVFLPLDATLEVAVGDAVKSNVDVLAKLA